MKICHFKRGNFEVVDSVLVTSNVFGGQLSYGSFRAFAEANLQKKMFLGIGYTWVKPNVSTNLGLI